MTWARGMVEIEALLRDGDLHRIPPNPSHVAFLLEDAQRSLAAAQTTLAVHPPAAFELGYSAARKACAALLAAQGLRPTSRGGHVAVERAVRAQFGGAHSVFERYGELRRRRHDAEYPSVDTAPLLEVDAVDGLALASAIIDAAERLAQSEVLQPFD